MRAAQTEARADTARAPECEVFRRVSCSWARVWYSGTRAWHPGTGYGGYAACRDVFPTQKRDAAVR